MMQPDDAKRAMLACVWVCGGTRGGSLMIGVIASSPLLGEVPHRAHSLAIYCAYMHQHARMRLVFLLLSASHLAWFPWLDELSAGMLAKIASTRKCLTGKSLERVLQCTQADSSLHCGID